MARRDYKGAAVPTTITSTINSSATSWDIADVTGWPLGTAGPFFVVLNDNEANEEKVLIQSRTGTTLNVATSGRGSDDTVASAHSNGASIKHVFTKTDADEANEHVNAADPAGHTGLLNNARHDLTTRHLAGTSIPVAAPIASVAGDTVSTGVSTSLPRADHRHDRAADPQGLTGIAYLVATQSGIISETVITGASVAVTIGPGTRQTRVVLRVFLGTTASGSAIESATVRIYANGSLVAGETFFIPATGGGYMCCVEYIGAVTGAITYTGRVLRAYGTGSILTAVASTTYIAVEDLGQ